VIEESVARVYLAKNRDKRLARMSAPLESHVPRLLQPDKAKDLSELFSVPSDRPKAPDEQLALSAIDSVFAMDSTVAQWYSRKGKLWVLNGLPVNVFRSECSEGEFHEWLQPTVTMQSDDPKIKELSNTLRGGLKDPCALVEKFTAYVFTMLKKRNTATFSNALETLKAGFGDCGEHAVLLGALLRAAGIPARVVLGLVYVGPKKAYMYHAWVMALAGDWVLRTRPSGRFPHTELCAPYYRRYGGGILRVFRLVGRINIEYITLSGSKADGQYNLERNGPCWCGQRKKYKKCHLRTDLEKGRKVRKRRGLPMDGPCLKRRRNRKACAWRGAFNGRLMDYIRPYVKAGASTGNLDVVAHGLHRRSWQQARVP